MQQVVQDVFLIGTGMQDATGDLLHAAIDALHLFIVQVDNRIFRLAKEKRIALIFRAGCQQAFKQTAFAKQVLGRKVVALPGERNKQAGPE